MGRRTNWPPISAGDDQALPAEISNTPSDGCPAGMPRPFDRPASSRGSTGGKRRTLKFAADPGEEDNPDRRADRTIKGRSIIGRKGISLPPARSLVLVDCRSCLDIPRSRTRFDTWAWTSRMRSHWPSIQRFDKVRPCAQRGRAPRRRRTRLRPLPRGFARPPFRRLQLLSPIPEAAFSRLP